MCVSCVAAQNPGSFTDEVEIRGYHLKLSDHRGQCTLNYTKEGKRVFEKLSLSGSCYFTRYSSRKVKVFSYQEANVLAALIVVGNPISKETRATWNL